MGMNNTDADILNLPLIKGGQSRDGWELYRQAARCWPGLYRIVAISLLFVCITLAQYVVANHAAAVIKAHLTTMKAKG